MRNLVDREALRCVYAEPLFLAMGIGCSRLGELHSRPAKVHEGQKRWLRERREGQRGGVPSEIEKKLGLDRQESR